MLARLSYPNNLTIWLGAHRASIYGATAAAKTAALTTAAKDPIREFHARELMSMQVHLKILEEEFPEYQKLLDNMEVEPTPITLLRLPYFGPAPFDSGQNKRAGHNEREMQDTGASGSGKDPTDVTTGIADESLPPHTAPTRLGTPILAEDISRDDAITTFSGSPLFPEPSQLKVDHISTVLAMAVEGGTQKAAMKLTAPSHLVQAATMI
jgi:hypothetical protein